MGRREFSSKKSSKSQNGFCATIPEFNAPVKGYLVGYLDFLYYLGSIPFKPKLITNSRGRIAFYTNSFQKGFCALLSLSALFHNLRHIIAESGDNLVQKPIRIFTVFIGLVRILYSFWWIRLFWSYKGQHNLQQFLGQLWISQKNFSKYSRKQMWLICLTLVAVTVLGVCLLGDKLWKPENCSDLLKVNFNTLLKDSAMISNETFSEENAHSSSCSFGVTIFHLFLNFCFIQAFFLQYCFATLVFILALSALQFCKGQLSKIVAANTAVTIIGNSMSPLHLEGVYRKSADEIRDYFQHLNQFASGSFLVWFSMVVPKLSYSVIESVPGVHDVHPLRIFHNWIVIVLYGLCLLACAEVRRQVEKVQDNITFHILFPKSHSSSMRVGKSTIAYLNQRLQIAGLRGGHFFIFSYGFLGSVIGLVVAYSFLALQFHVQVHAF